MLRSLFSGVSGMKNQQTKMDVIGNNIANVNTTAYKSSRVTFKDMLSQSVQGASSPTTTVGGTNPKQVGLGMSIGSIDTDMGQGSLQSTGRSADLSIQGNGFFIVKSGNDKYYTRDGSFTLDKNGDLLTSEGYHLIGENYVDKTTDFINIPLDHDVVPKFALNASGTPAKEVAKIKLYGFDGGDSIKEVIFDRDTEPTDVKIDGKEYGKIGVISYDDTSKKITINAKGFENMEDLNKVIVKYLSLVNNITNDTLNKTGAVADPEKKIRALLKGTGISGVNLSGDITDFAAGKAYSSTDGSSAPGTDKSTIKKERTKLTSYQIGKNGIIRSIYGEDAFEVGKVKLATFQNPSGLEKKGGNMYLESANSGQAQDGSAADNGFGTIEQGFLEMSKVDLANEFTEMIITSRAYQANSKTISTSDEMLQELINLKR